MVGTRWHAFFSICSSNYRGHDGRETELSLQKSGSRSIACQSRQVHAEGQRCPIFQPVPAVIVVAPDGPHAMDFALNIAGNGIGSTTKHDVPIQRATTTSTTRPRGESYGGRSWRQTHSAKPASR